MEEKKLRSGKLVVKPITSRPTASREYPKGTKLTANQLPTKFDVIEACKYVRYRHRTWKKGAVYSEVADKIINVYSLVNIPIHEKKNIKGNLT